METPQEKFILDATAGFRMMWFNKQHPNAIYLDQRPECEPDVVGDFRDLKRFSDNTFRLIIFDPPHILRNSDNHDSNILRRFGALQSDSWRSDLKSAANELWRVLKDYGVLIFKWNTQYTPSNEVLKLFPVEPIIYQVSATSTRKYQKGRMRENVKTLWFCFMKIPQISVKNQESPEVPDANTSLGNMPVDDSHSSPRVRSERVRENSLRIKDNLEAK
jgi:hypothetical protein